MTTAPVKLMFDSDCKTCRLLAHWLEQRSQGSLRVESLQANGYENHQLGLVNGAGKVVFGPAAWHELISLHPDFRGLSWLARKLNLEQTTAHTAQKVGGFIRNVCWRC